MTRNACVDISALAPGDLALIQAAKVVMANAYNPYSGFFVGAAVGTRTGGTFTGTFIENASFGVTVCAEAAAILGAYAKGDVGIFRIAVVGGTGLNSSGDVITPCGKCRQMIYEVAQVAGEDLNVLCCNADLSRILKKSITELLPFPFGSKNLESRERMEEFIRRSQRRPEVAPP